MFELSPKAGKTPSGRPEILSRFFQDRWGLWPEPIELGKSRHQPLTSRTTEYYLEQKFVPVTEPMLRDRFRAS